MNRDNDISQEQMFFSIFCIESLSKKLGIFGGFVYEKLAEESDILDEYIISNYDVLHTQSEEYITQDLFEIMESRGVSV